jgi:sugar phosphate isomerase/epimerase
MTINRRNFLKATGIAGAGAGLALLNRSMLTAAETAAGAPTAEKLGWRLGGQLWTFNKFPFDEGIDKVASLGLHYAETFGGKFSKDFPNASLNENATADMRKMFKKKLADAGVQLKSYGVTPLYKEIDKSRKVFEFAKEMDFETICSEPPEDAFDTVEKLCDEYGINVAIHNHPQPSHYWNPDTVLKVCKGRSQRIGACCDTGHWKRSGLNPLECLKKLEGRIITFHFKDLNRLDKKLVDVPWGTGICDAKGMLQEIHRQKVKALFLIEYEHYSENIMDELTQCIKFFEKTATELIGS